MSNVLLSRYNVSSNKLEILFIVLINSESYLIISSIKNSSLKSMSFKLILIGICEKWVSNVTYEMILIFIYKFKSKFELLFSSNILDEITLQVFLYSLYSFFLERRYKVFIQSILCCSPRLSNLSNIMLEILSIPLLILLLNLCLLVYK